MYLTYSFIYCIALVIVLCERKLLLLYQITQSNVQQERYIIKQRDIIKDMRKHGHISRATISVAKWVACHGVCAFLLRSERSLTRFMFPFLPDNRWNDWKCQLISVSRCFYSTVPAELLLESVQWKSRRHDNSTWNLSAWYGMVRRMKNVQRTRRQSCFFVDRYMINDEAYGIFRYVQSEISMRENRKKRDWSWNSKLERYGGAWKSLLFSFPCSLLSFSCSQVTAWPLFPHASFAYAEEISMISAGKEGREIVRDTCKCFLIESWDSHELAAKKKFPDGRAREIAASSRGSSRLREAGAGITMKMPFAPEPLLAVL